MNREPYAPRSSEPDEIEAHAERLASRLALSGDQAMYLVSELRNALAPVVLDAANLPEAMMRLLKLADAIADRRQQLARTQVLQVVSSTRR